MRLRPPGLPKVALWLAASHLVLAGVILTWASRLFASWPIGQGSALPPSLRSGLAVLENADWPTIWLTMQLDHIKPLPPLVAVATPVILGTVQWFLVGLMVDLLLRSFKARWQSR